MALTFPSVRSMGPGFGSGIGRKRGGTRCAFLTRFGLTRFGLTSFGYDMVHFDDILTPEALSTSVSVGGKKQLFQRLGEIAAAAYGLDAATVCERLTERERLGSTGFGGGVGIPHAKIAGLDQVRGMVILLDDAIGFDAVDDAPVDVVFALLSPLDSGAEHLKTLARVSRYLRNDGQITRLRGVGSDAALFALLSGNEARDAA